MNNKVVKKAVKAMPEKKNCKPFHFSNDSFLKASRIAELLFDTLEIAGIIKECTNSVTGEIQYKTAVNEITSESIYMLDNELRHMLYENCDTLFSALINGGIEELVYKLDNIQAVSNQTKVVYNYDCSRILAYKGNETIIEVHIPFKSNNEGLNESNIQSIIDTILVNSSIQ